MQKASKIITIDGPAGAGKSTVARKLAMKLGAIHLNSGALYRAVALKALEEGVSFDDIAGLERIAKSLDFQFSVLGAATVLRVDGKDLQEQLSQPAVAAGASKIATVSIVRDALNEVQRRVAKGLPVAKEKGVVLEGRDAGTVVFPNADAKFFLVASVEQRAQRRFDELLAKGLELELSQVLSEIAERDHRDENRAVAPQKPASDSILIDTSDKDIAAVIEEILFHLMSKGFEVE